MLKPQQFIGKWIFDYWIELGKSTILTIEDNGVAHTKSGTLYHWVLENDCIHIFIDGFVDYVGVLKDGVIDGYATSDYSMNRWAWQAKPWTGPTIYPIKVNDIVRKKWVVLNETEELDNFSISFISENFVETPTGRNEKWYIEEDRLVFTHANGYITYRAQNIDGEIKGQAENLACFEWNFNLAFLENISIASPKKPASPKLDVTTKKYKDDKDKIIKYLNNNNVEYFYHFTDIENIPFIKKYGGLFSWHYILEHGLNVPKQGGDELSKSLDRKYGLENYVRLSFCIDHPMAFICKTHRNMELVLLKVKVDVATLRETRFSNINATAKNHLEGPSFADLQRINIAATREHYLRNGSVVFAQHQAEVMVKQHIPLEYIININNPERI